MADAALVEVPEARPSDLTVIDKAIAGNLPAAELSIMVDAQMRVLDRNAEIEFNAAMSDVQMALPAILQTSTNEHTRSKYAKLNAILKVARPVYSGMGFSLSFAEADCPRENWIRVTAKLRHRDGHTENYHTDVPSDTHGIGGKANKTEMHGNASAKQYGQRYLMSMIFNLELTNILDTDGSPPVLYITRDQEANLLALIEETGADMEGFLRLCRADTLDLVTAAQYQGAVSRLVARRK